MGNNNKVTLDNLTDYQKSLLMSLSYVDVDMKQFKDLKQNGTEITISDLNSILSNPDATYLGSLDINGLTNFVTGVNTSSSELLKQLVDSGLGNLNIVDIVHDSKSGLHAMCFSDDLNNRGFSFRGTDVQHISNLVQDSYTDLEGFLLNDTAQVYQANNFFEQHSNNDGKNHLYGHSLGGFLVENIYANNHENIKNAFVVSPLHINQQKLDTQDKINAFNNPEKFSCYCTGGDYISHFNRPNLFQNGIKYLQNNNAVKNNFIGNHLIESASFDENGNFITTSKEEAYKDHKSLALHLSTNIANNNFIRTTAKHSLIYTKAIFNGIRKAFNFGKDLIVNQVNNIKALLTRNSSEGNTIGNLNLHNTAFRESLKLENYINNTTYTRADYENAKEILRNPMKYISDYPKHNESLNLETTEKVPWPAR